MDEHRRLTYSSLPGIGTVRPRFSAPALTTPLLQMMKSPSYCWTSFGRDQRNIKRLFEDIVFVLAAIPAVCGTIGFGFFGGTSLPRAIALGIVAYLATICFLYAASHLACRTAWLFGEQMSLDTAGKLIVYSFMPAMIAAMFFIHPDCAFLALSGISSLYLFYHGVCQLTGLSTARMLTYYAVNIVSWIVVADTVFNLIPGILAKLG